MLKHCNINALFPVTKSMLHFKNIFLFQMLRTKWSRVILLILLNMTKKRDTEREKNRERDGKKKAERERERRQTGFSKSLADGQLIA